MKNYSLLTNDNETIEIDIEKIQELKLIMELIDSNDDDSDDEEDNQIEIPIDVESKILKKILEACNYEYENRDNNITDDDKFNWYNNYFICNEEDLHKLLESADYLNYDSLVDLGCEKIANDIRSCNSLDDVKKKLSVSKEITKEEENELLNQYK